jgi:putative ABC transport system ATP-binding protein
MRRARTSAQTGPLAAPTGRRLLSDGVVLDEVTVADPRGGRPLVDRLSFRAAAKTITLLVGPRDRRTSAVLGGLAGTAPVTSGALWVNGVEVSALSGDELAAYRAEQVGVVTETPDLLQHGTVRENLALALRSDRLLRSTATRRIDEALQIVDLNKVGHQRASRLTLGEQRRVAIARALVLDPVLLVLDEPCTGLSPADLEEMVRTLRRCAANGLVVVASTTDERLGAIAEYVVELHTTPAVRLDEDGVPHRDGRVERLRYPAGDVIFEAGTWVDRVFCIDVGSVELRSDGAAPVVLEGGGFFGEVGALLGRPQAASAVAKTSVEVRSYASDEFVRVYGPAELRRLLASTQQSTRRL